MHLTINIGDTTMEIYVVCELKNFAQMFYQAIWRKCNVMRTYASAAEAGKYHNLKNCCYEHRKGGEVVARFNNAKIDEYGRRYN